MPGAASRDNAADMIAAEFAAERRHRRNGAGIGSVCTCVVPMGSIKKQCGDRVKPDCAA